LTDALWDRIDERCERWNVLRHPFYVRWSEGSLTRDELARYAGQYRHAVEALAWMTASGGERLARHAAEEAAHVELWDRFADAAGCGEPAEANAETRECVEAWAAGDGLPATLARMYAIESAQPEIARVKREGLVSLYGFEEGPATEYFRVHEQLDAEHAAEVRDLIDELCAEEDEELIVAAAESAVRANWRLLDGV
jgi:pyrroloquinoline-quinone synthase